MTALREYPAARCPATEDVTLRDARRAGQRDAETRDRWAQSLTVRLDVPMAVLGLVFLLVVLGQDLASSSGLRTGLSVVAWLLWGVFVGEFALRLYVAADRRRFLRRNWWQLIFLVVPVLRFLRAAQLLRAARAGRVLSSAVRSSRSAGRVARTRLAWIGSISVIVALSASQLLYAFGGYDRYGPALHDAAFATVSGEPLSRRSGLGSVLEIVLAAYSVVVFAALAGALGALFLHGSRPAQEPAPPRTPADRTDGGAAWSS